MTEFWELHTAVDWLIATFSFLRFCFLVHWKLSSIYWKDTLSSGLLLMGRKHGDPLEVWDKMGFQQTGIWEFCVVGCFDFFQIIILFLIGGFWEGKKGCWVLRNFGQIRLWWGLGLGQLLSLLNTSTDFASSELARRGISALTSQSFLNYVLLAIVYGTTMILQKKALKATWYYHIVLA